MVIHQIIRDNTYFPEAGMKTHDLFASVNERISRKFASEHFILDHYSARIWNRSHHGSIQLYGHSHGALPPYKMKDGSLARSMDVGVDTRDDMKPYSLTEILGIMRKRPSLYAGDHHIG